MNIACLPSAFELHIWEHFSIFFFLCQAALVQPLADQTVKEYFHPRPLSELPVLLIICINNIYMDGMSGFKTLIQIISMAPVLIINFNEPALCCKPIHIYTLAINIMELLTGLQQWHVRKLAPEVQVFTSRPFSSIIYGILGNKTNWQNNWWQNKMHKTEVTNATTFFMYFIIISLYSAL